MSNILSIFKLLPGILSAVQAVEAAIPLPSAGKTKLDLVLGIANDIYNAEQTIKKDFSSDQLVTMITATVNRIVAAFNSLGIFPKKTA